MTGTGPSTAPAIRPAASAMLGDLAVVMAIALAEAALFGLAWSAGVLNTISSLAIHVVAVGALTAAVVRRSASGRDVGPMAIMALATAATGPIGALLAPLAIAWARRSGEPPRLLEAWYERIALSTEIDSITRLADKVRVGRVTGEHGPGPVSFSGVISGGSVAEQQTVLGLVARSFHREHLPALQAALRSPEPVIRVQAAAVATRIRPSLIAMVDRAVAVASEASVHSRDTGFLALADLKAAVASGLLDAGQRRYAEDAMARLQQVMTTSRQHRDVPRTVSEIEQMLALGPAARAALEAELVEHGRFRDWRRLRHASRVCIGRLYRLRAVGAPVRRRGLVAA